MRGGVLLLVALVAVGSNTIEVTAAGAGSGNTTHDRLLALPPLKQAEVLAENLHNGCVGISAFPMGVTSTGKAKGFAYWSVRCKDGRSFAVQIEPNAKGTVTETDCRNLQGSGKECFKKF